MKETILVTGGAGFIASNLIKKLLSSDQYNVIGIDNFDPFYSRDIKEYNLKSIVDHPNFVFIEGDILDNETLYSLGKIDIIVHLAAKAGVRPSIADPIAYEKVNVGGTLNLLEYAKNRGISRFIFASSSSVYGINENVPWSESDKQLTPISPYAATKLSGEMMGHVFSYLYNVNFIALRFFTVYGPGQRPDLAIHKFFNQIYHSNPIDIYGDGNTLRDYTYIDDIVDGIIKTINYSKVCKFEVINLGNNLTVALKDLIGLIEKISLKPAVINRLSEQAGDVPRTFANISKAQSLLDYYPKTKIEEGLEKFYGWYCQLMKK